MLVFVVDHFYEKCVVKLKKHPFYICVYYKLDFFEKILLTEFVQGNDSILINSQLDISCIFFIKFLMTFDISWMHISKIKQLVFI